MAKPTTANRTKPTANAETPSGYFRRILRENRRLLKGRNNQELLDRWLADHPGEKGIPDNIRGILSNVKSVLRSKRRGRKKAARAAEVGSQVQVAGTALPKMKGHKLDRLEEQIDDVLAVAKSLDREGLDHVIKLLRHARNEVVWKMGQ